MKKITTRSIGLISLALGLLTSSAAYAMNDGGSYGYDQPQQYQRPLIAAPVTVGKDPRTWTPIRYQQPTENVYRLGTSIVSVDAYGNPTVSWTPTASADQFGLSYSAPQSNNSQTQQFIALGQATYTLLSTFIDLLNANQNSGNEFGVGGTTTTQPVRPAVQPATTGTRPVTTTPAAAPRPWYTLPIGELIARANSTPSVAAPVTVPPRPAGGYWYEQPITIVGR